MITFRFGCAVLAAVLATLTPARAYAPPAASSQDGAIYEAILAAKIRPQVDRFSAGAGIHTPAPVLTFDRTLALCSALAAPAPKRRCIRDEWVQSFATAPPGVPNLRFEKFLTSTARKELAKSFRERNQSSHTFPATNIEGLILASSETIDEVARREASRTKGFTGFSLPAYSTDGRALVYASYVCGGLCGYGWLFLLERRADSWHVVSTEMLWIS